MILVPLFSTVLKQKIKRIQHHLRQKGLDTLFFGNLGHHIHDDLLYYLLLQKREISLCFLPVRGKPTLAAIPFEVDQLQEAFPAFHVVPFRGSISEFLDLCLTKQKRISTLAVRPAALPVSVYRTIKKKTSFRVRDFGDIAPITSTKLQEEIHRMTKAAHLTDTIFRALLTSWKQFRRELDVAEFLVLEMYKAGIEPSFPPIVASGTHASEPHHESCAHRLSRGFCVIDMGVRYRGYCSDMTRTVFIGKPTKKEKILYQRLLEAQEQTILKVKQGSSTRELDIFCRKILGEKNSKHFIHALGHGLGTQVHEWPSVNRHHHVVLQPNMVMTIEPGLYVKNKYGIRIEDDILITEKGARVLTRAPKHLLTFPCHLTDS